MTEIYDSKQIKTNLHALLYDCSITIKEWTKKILIQCDASKIQFTPSHLFSCNSQKLYNIIYKKYFNESTIRNLSFDDIIELLTEYTNMELLNTCLHMRKDFKITRKQL